MTGDVGLSARLIRGAGSSDVVRLVMMAVGIGLSVAALLIAVTVPRALGAASDREASRVPVWGNPPAHSAPLKVETSQTATGNTLWTQFRLRGGGTGSPVPPGLGELPAPGHSVVSAAVRELLRKDPRQGVGLGTIDAAVIDDDGLVRPSELVSYTRLPDAASAAPAASPAAGPNGPVAPSPGAAPSGGPGTSVTAFGDPSMSSGLSAPLGLEAMLLVALPALLFLSVCARLSVTSRRARLSSLRLIGLSLDRCARIFSGELTIVAAAGAVAGVGLYLVGAPWLSQGVLGVTWFSSDTVLNPVAAVVCVSLCCVVTAVVSRRSMVRMLAEGEAQRRWRSWPLYLGGILLLVGGGFVTAVVIKVLRAAPEDPILAPAIHVPLVMGACAAAMAGLLVALPGLVTRLSQWLSTRDLPVSVRLGARQAATQSSLSARLLAALVATVMAVGLSSAFLYSTFLDAVGDPKVAVLNIDLANAPRAQRQALAASLPATSETFIVADQTSDQQQVYIYVTTCERYVRAYSEPDTQCSPGPVRLGADTSPETIKAGATVSVAQVDGPPITLTAPNTSIGGVGAMTLVIPPAQAPWALTTPKPLVTVNVPSDQADTLQAQLRAMAPSAVIQRVTKDPLSLARYVEQSAVLRSALSLAYLLCILTFIFSLIEGRWAAERTLVAQRAIGIPAGTTRRAHLVQAALPVAVGALLVVPATAASGIAFLAFWGAGNARDLTTWTPITLLAVGALTATAATGWALGRSRLRLDVLAE